MNQPLTHDEELLEDVELCRAYIAEARRGIVTKHTGLEVFSECDHAAEIKSMSRGMTIQEICDFYGISVHDLPDKDKFFFYAMFLKGRVNGVTIATQKLFANMTGREGTKASLMYLARFGENWSGATEDAKVLGAAKSLRIEIMDS